MNSIIYDTLVKAKKSKKIVSLISDPFDQSECSVGIVNSINDSEVRLKSISPNGQFDGYEVLTLKNIQRVDVDGQYEKKIDFLWKNRGNIFNEIEIDNKIINDDIIFSTLSEAKKNELIVILRGDNEDDEIIGYVIEVDENEVKILSIDEYGKKDGYVLLDFSSIYGVDCNSLRCQKLKYLNKNK